MRNIFNPLCFVFSALFLFSCSKDEATQIAPPKSFAEQYPIDNKAIDDYLATHYYDEINDELKDLIDGEVALKDNPNLDFIIVNRNNLEYKLYFLKIEEGNTTEGLNPIEVDSAFVSYKGTLLNGTVFDAASSPVWFKLDEVIIGWAKIIPKFKTAGTPTVNSDGSLNYGAYGKGIMFVPSSFGYYNSSFGKIPPYSQLIFRFNLFSLKRRDHDKDRILSIDEYFDANGAILNTDGDRFPNYLDIDDDGDGYLTKSEIRTSAAGVSPGTYYSFENIPNCEGGSVKKHLDASCN